MSTVQHGFTLDPVAWDAWLDIIDISTATPEQIAVLEESTPTAKTSPYYLLLAHDVEVLRQRSRLFNAVMYGGGGLKRADRELATVVVSRINGCVYCASVHARRFVQLRKTTEPVQSILEQGIGTELGERDRALVDYAEKLTTTPHLVEAADLAPLRQIGLTDLEILDLTHAIAMFAWANRLMQSLGHVVYEPAEEV